MGCGFDTLYWRLRDAGHMINNFVELDFPTVTSKKCYFIKRNKNLLSKIYVEGILSPLSGVCEMFRFNEKFIIFLDEDIRFNPTDLHAPNYHIMGVDLRNVDEVANKLKQAEVDFTVPTIFLAECVLVYIEAQNCTNLLKWFSSQFQTAVFVIYEQVRTIARVILFN